MRIDDTIDLELNMENVKYLVYTEHIEEFDDYYDPYDDDDDYFLTYEEYVEEYGLDAIEWCAKYGDMDEEEWCINFMYEHPEIKIITIPIYCLDDYSMQPIRVQCESCGEVYYEEYNTHLKNSYKNGDLCPNCVKKI